MLDSDWIQITNKKGKQYCIGDLKSYALDEIRAGNFTETKDDYNIICPYCVDAYKQDKSYKGVPYTKYKLYVTKDYNIGHCFRCDKFFLNSDDSVNYDFSVPEDPIGVIDFSIDKLNGKVWNLDLFESFDEESELGYNYLIRKRHSYFKQLAKGLNIRYLNGNPVIPFYFQGELINYQIKVAYPDRLPKGIPHDVPYFNPPIGHKPCYIIEHGDNKKLVVSEGTFDAIADLILYPDRTPVAVLGSTITEYQIAMLRTYVPEDIIVYMDDTELSIKVADKLSRYLNYTNITIRPSDGMDPEEYLKYKISIRNELL